MPSNAIRRDLFAAILRKPSLFFHEHESQQLTMLVNQLSLQVQSALQDVLINPVLDLFGVVLLGYSLFHSLQAVQARGGNQVWLFFSVIVLIALLSPWLVSRMGSRLRQSSQNASPSPCCANASRSDEAGTARSTKAGVRLNTRNSYQSHAGGSH